MKSTLIQSFNEAQSQKSLLPEWTDFFYCFLTGLICCVLLNSKLIIDWLRNRDIGATYEIWGGAFQRIGSFLDTGWVTTTVTALFWGIVGLLVYICIWMIIKSRETYEQEVGLFKRVVLPRHTTGKQMLRHEIIYWAFRVAGTLLLITWIYLLFLGLSSYKINHESLQQLSTMRLVLYGTVQALALGTWFLVGQLLVRASLARRRILR